MAFLRGDSSKRHSIARFGQAATACILCAALGCVGIAPALSYADPADSTEFAQDADPSVADGTGDEATSSGETSSAADASSESDRADSADSSSSKSVHTKKTSASDSASLKPAKSSSKKAKKDAKKTAVEKAKEKAKIASAKEAINEMATLSAQLETAYEDLNEQQTALKKAKKAIAQTKADIKTAKQDLSAAQDKVAVWAKETYVNGSVRYLAVLLNATTFSDFLERFMFCSRITEEAQDAVEEVKTLQGKLSEENQKLADKYSEKKSLTAKAQESAETIQNSLLEQAAYYSALPAKIRKAVKNYDGVKNSLAAIQGMTGSTSKKGSHPEVVTEALKYLGVDYVWGGETPDGFDCSGLVMYCYEKACGISLTHFARTQYSEGKKIARSALMPGDLVFFGPNVAGIHHVGIYMGNDKFIQAPQTGDVVKISTLSSRSDYVGACRP